MDSAGIPDPEIERLEAMLVYEREAWAAGRRCVAGVDEAGRGPLAGPVVAAAVVLPRERLIAGIDDSKRLTAAAREAVFARLAADPEVRAGVGVCSVEEIEALNILGATWRAMIRAVEALPVQPDFLLVDGTFIKGMTLPHRRIVKGDRLSASIAAASIVAKVTRDRLMLELDGQYGAYGFARHKGYGTKHHVEMLRKHGPCPAHRKGFAPVKELLGAREIPREGGTLWATSST
ncbi:MAG: ribonuclease HII [Verrucomicrobia bacterium]|nr:ribonuclease HII [Verrucomicrobiota bacterium]